LLGADTFHKPGFKMHARILHHLFGVASSDVIKAPLWDVTTKGRSNCAFSLFSQVSSGLCSEYPSAVPSLQLNLLNAESAAHCCAQQSNTAAAQPPRCPDFPSAAGPTAYPNNAAFVHEFVTNLLTTSFPNMRPQQVQVRCLLCSFKPKLRMPMQFRIAPRIHPVWLRVLSQAKIDGHDKVG
jgi:CRM1 C terminal